MPNSGHRELQPLCAQNGFCFAEARLAQSAERKALNLVVVGPRPMVGALSFGFAQAAAR